MAKDQLFGIELACEPSFDIEGFRSSCRVPLNPGGWNVWRLSLSNVEAPSIADYRETVRAWLNRWFGAIPGGSAIWTDNFDHYEIQILPIDKSPTSWTYTGPDGKLVNPNATYALVASSRDAERLACSKAVIDVRKDYKIPLYDAWVKFVYRGTATSMPWPTGKTGLAGYDNDAAGNLRPVIGNAFCPIDADVALLQAFRFIKPPAVPSKPSIIEGATSYIPDTLNPTKTISGAVFWGLIGVGTIWMVSNAVSRRAESIIP